MRDTLHIRSIMRKYGAEFLWTNKYKTKRTVKCWAGRSVSVNAILVELKQNGYSARYIPRGQNTMPSIIADCQL